MPTPIANKNRAGLMGPEQVKLLDEAKDASKLTTGTLDDARLSARLQTSGIDASLDSAVRRALNHTIWIAG